MSFPEIMLLAIGLSMDAFAVAVCAGLSMPQATFRKALIVGLYFGVFQAAMPLIGYALATQFADKIVSFDHWIAFVLLSFIGGKMIAESFRKAGCPDRECPPEKCADRECPDAGEASLGPAAMLPLALATSIDALAAGVPFAFLNVDIVPAILSIGATTLVLSAAGVKIGKIFGRKFKAKAEFAGGIILIGLGLKILLEHLLG